MKKQPRQDWTLAVVDIEWEQGLSAPRLKGLFEVGIDTVEGHSGIVTLQRME
jgi:hypothetical protein